MEERLIFAKENNPKNKLRYPELQQFITNWLGFKFWQWETHFNPREHIKMRKVVTNKKGLNLNFSDF